MKRCSIALLLLVLAVATACGTASPAAAPSASFTPATVLQQLVVEGDDATRVIDTATGTTTTLPGGVLSPTSDLIVHVNSSAAKTAIAGVDLAGKPVFDLALPGDYRVPNAYGAAPSGFSPNGKFMVLVSRDAAESRFAVIDVARRAVTQTATLSSRFTFDAIHNDGTAMYLIEHPQPGTTAYNVRFYDLAANTLKPDIIFDKAAIAQWDPTVGLMDGTFHVSVAPKTGDWSFGLYMRPNGKPFVHALNVPGHYAQCIVDLAGNWTPASLFSMALADDGRKLYVVDTAGGTVSVIDALSQHVLKTGSFQTRGGVADPRSTSAVISKDGTRLYATAAGGVASLLTSDLSLRGWLAPDLKVRSLALSNDGARLFALSGDAIQVIDASTGKVVSQLASAPGARALRVLTRGGLASSR
jgi:DNA-binding beta-propeller fold protein YncE